MRVYTKMNECFVHGKGWIKPNTLTDFNEVTQINYNYIDIRIIDSNEVITRGQCDVTITESRDMSYADGCRINYNKDFLSK